MKALLSILRVHIVLIGVFGAVVFGWLMTDRYLWWIALIGGMDWLLINLANRVSDIREDSKNIIPGTERVAQSPRGYTAAFVLLLAGSFALTVPLFPELTGWRLFMQLVGFVYSFPVIPWRGQRLRLKEVYLLKNLLSGLGFIVTCFFYPLAHNHFHSLLDWPAIIMLILYFLPFELTYEILYDLRDVAGDREAGIPTYPVVHGETVTHRIIHSLLLASVLFILAAFLTGVIGVKELLIGAGPIIQYFLFRPILRRGPSTRDCIRVTNLGVGMLIVYLISTALWLWAGLPVNIYL